MFFFSCPGFALKEDGILSHYVLDILGKQWPDFLKVPFIKSMARHLGLL